MSHTPKPASHERRMADLFHRIEQVVYIVVAGLLVLALMLALAGAASLLLEGAHDWTTEEAVVRVIDRLLFVLMLVEILHTVHASVRTGTLVCEPFLVVGLIASIRRVLVITLETSQITMPDKWDVAKEPLFRANMIELGVLAGLIAVLITSLRVLRPNETGRAIDGLENDEE